MANTIRTIRWCDNGAYKIKSNPDRDDGTLTAKERDCLLNLRKSIDKRLLHVSSFANVDLGNRPDKADEDEDEDEERRENEIRSDANDPYGKTSPLFYNNGSSVRAGNQVGVLQTAGPDGNPLRLEIHSRFDSNQKSYFLLYLFSRIYGFDIHPREIGAGGDSVFDIILCVLFCERLMGAYEQGLFKVYRRYRHNDYDFRGTLDVARHIRLNTPFLGKTAYTTREFSYDNEILCLIRQTIGFVQLKYESLWTSYQSANPLLMEIERVIEEATPSFRMNCDYSSSVQCCSEITHPLLRDYEQVRRICRSILRGEAGNIYHSDRDESFGLIVDMAWLWEEFVSLCLLKAESPDGRAPTEEPPRYKHLQRGVEDSKNYAPKLYRDSGYKSYRYPDFIERVRQNEAMTKKTRRNFMDAKYKHWAFSSSNSQKNAAARNDLHQFVTYFFLTGGTACGVVFPARKGAAENGKEDLEEERIVQPFPGFYPADCPEVKICKLPFYVPMYEDKDSYAFFCEKMEKAIAEWEERVRDKKVFFPA